MSILFHTPFDSSRIHVADRYILDLIKQDNVHQQLYEIFRPKYAHCGMFTYFYVLEVATKVNITFQYILHPSILLLAPTTMKFKHLHVSGYFGASLDGKRYLGQCDENRAPHGFGTFIWENGVYYTGEWKHGVRDGIGFFRNPEKQETFFGWWKQDHKEGFHILRNEIKKLVYQGPIIAGNAHGTDVIVQFDDGAVYTGEMTENQFTGKGVFTHPTPKYTYIGTFDRFREHGYGKAMYHDQSQFEGYFHHGIKHGKGKFTSANGTTIECVWVHGKRDQKGIITWTTGKKYTGEFVKNKPHGKGRMEYPDGSWYEGQFQAGQLHGVGKFQYTNGKFYIGQYQHNNKHGYGLMKYDQHCTYTGFWYNNNKHGNGVFTSTLLQIMYRGVWHHGQASEELHELIRERSNQPIQLPQDQVKQRILECNRLRRTVNFRRRNRNRKGVCDYFVVISHE